MLVVRCDPFIPEMFIGTHIYTYYIRYADRCAEKEHVPESDINSDQKYPLCGKIWPRDLFHRFSANWNTHFNLREICADTSFLSSHYSVVTIENSNSALKSIIDAPHIISSIIQYNISGIIYNTVMLLINYWKKMLIFEFTLSCCSEIVLFIK